MGRNSSGTYSLPSGPVIPGTTISTTWANNVLGDFSTETTDSLSRSGKGPMLAAVRTPDGSVAAPAYSFTSETGTGWYKSAAGEIAAALAGVLAAKFTSTGIKIFGAARAFLQSVDANSVVQILGNRNAADVGADVETNGQVTRTAGLLLQVNNNSTPKLLVDYLGLARLDAGAAAAAIQPTSIWTAITPATGYTAFDGLSYLKDASGTVRMKGRARSDGTGSATAFTLPVGFRPLVARSFLLDDTTGAGIIKCLVNADGTVANKAGVVVPNGNSMIVDPISFLAEQ